jgi:fermentation-respiration switch protein FrsA (DUF1100 family)
MFFTDSYLALRRGKRRLALRYAVISVLTLALLFLPLGYFLMRRFETAVTFHPDREPASGSWRAPAGAEDVWFETADGVRLHGWFFRSKAEAERATIVYFHGNGGNVSYTGWVGEAMARRGFDVLLFDYRGYGQSGGAVGGERGLYADADAAYRYVVTQRGADPRRVVLYGQSLGSAAAADVAARESCGALILESGLSSASDMAATILPWLPRALHRLGKFRFDTTGKLPRVRCPVFIAHGDRDEIIPVEQGHKLYAAAREPKQLRIVTGAGHNNLTILGGEAYLDALAAFVRDSMRVER